MDRELARGRRLKLRSGRRNPQILDLQAARPAVFAALFVIFSLASAPLEGERLAPRPPAGSDPELLGNLERAHTLYQEGSVDQALDLLGMLVEDQRQKAAKGALPLRVEPQDPLAQPWIRRELDADHRGALVQTLQRSGRYREMILAVLKREGLPRELAYLPMVESEFKPKAVSEAGAAGLWQLMPATARRWGLQVDYWVDERLDPEKSTVAAAKELQRLQGIFGDWSLALAAYNFGETSLRSGLSSAQAASFEDLRERGSLPAETREYVARFRACVLIGEDPQRYGLAPRYEPAEGYELVRLDRPLTLAAAARYARSSEAALRGLNPSLKRWCTPGGAAVFALKLPPGRRSRFLSELPSHEASRRLVINSLKR